MLRYADRMVGGWTTRPPSRPSAARAARLAAQLRVTLPEAERRLARLTVRQWEDRQLTAAELHSIDLCHTRAERVGAIISSAVHGLADHPRSP